MAAKLTVAYFDILGFRDLIQRESVSELAKRFFGTTDIVFGPMNKPLLPTNRDVPRFFPEHTEGAAWCISHFFSDSIVLISNTDSSQDCLKLLVFGIRTMQTLIASGFAIRGAATYDEMLVDVDRRLFLGRALTKAYDLEQSQDWIGATIDDSVEDAFPGIFGSEPFSETLAALFPKYQVPLKKGRVRDFRTFNWRWNLTVEKGTRSLFASSTDWAVHKKVAETLQYARYIRLADLAYPKNPELVPVEVAAFFIGSDPPPPRFIHGDDL